MQQQIIGEAATWLSIVSLLYTSRMDSLLAKHDLTFGQFSILHHIAQPELSGGTSISEIAKVVALKQPAVTKTIAKFESRGLVLIAANGKDNRAKKVTATVEGLGTLQLIRQSMGPDLARVFAHFSANQLEQFVYQLKELGKWLDQNRDAISNTNQDI